MPAYCDPVIRFWRQTDKDGPNHPKLGKCWTWLGCCKGRGYGLLRVGRKKIKSHRFAYTLLVGKIPDGLHVLHSCDNKKCVNPAHLFLGTNDDNVADKVKKNRQVKGEKSRGAILTATQVLEIRNRYRYMSRKHGCIAISRDYGVNDATVYSVVTRATWKHV